MIGGQKWSIILGMPWLTCHNPEINWGIEKMKMTRCPEKCGKQWRLKQGKPEWLKQKKEGKKKDEKEQKKKKPKKKKMMEVKK